MKFKIKDLFEVYGTRSLDAGSLEFQEKGINFIGRTGENNGIQGKIPRQNFSPNEANTITATVIGNYKYAKLQTEEYYTSQNINKLEPKKNYNQYIMKYFVAHVQKFLTQYNGQQSGYKLEDLMNHEIEVPTNEKNEIDENLITKNMKSYESKWILKTFQYIKKEYSYAQILEQKKIIKEITSAKYQEFYLFELFEIANTTNLIRSEIKSFDGTYPYVTASRENNGIKYYIDHDEDLLMEGNSLFIGGKTFTVFYQPEAYFSNDSHNLSLMLKEKKYRTREIQLYLAAAIYGSLKHKYEWGNSISKEKIQEDTIKLPSNREGKPDFELMANYIRVLEKNKIERVLDMLKNADPDNSYLCKNDPLL